MEELMNKSEVIAPSLADYKKVCRRIDKCMDNIAANIIKLAGELQNVKVTRLYELGGYKDIYSFAKDKFGISKTSCSNYIGLVETFGYNSEFSPSQMIELLPYVRSGGDLTVFNPDMSVREIRKAIKEQKAICSDVGTDDEREEEYVPASTKPQSYVFNITDDIMKASGAAVDAFYNDIRIAVANAYKKFGAKSIVITIK